METALGKKEKSSFISLPGKEIRIRLVPSRLCSSWKGSVSKTYSVSLKYGSLFFCLFWFLYFGCIPAVGVWDLNHWATRKVLKIRFLMRMGQLLGLYSSVLMEHFKTIKAGVRSPGDGLWWSLGLLYWDFLFWNEECLQRRGVLGSVSKRKKARCLIELWLTSELL